MKTADRLIEWCTGALAQFGDPAEAVTQAFFRWVDQPEDYRGEDLVCGVFNGKFGLCLGPDWPVTHLAIDVRSGAPEFDRDDNLITFGAERIQQGLWALTPSLNMPGAVHAFIVLYNVPSPPFWERRIILLGDLQNA